MAGENESANKSQESPDIEEDESKESSVNANKESAGNAIVKGCTDEKREGEEDDEEQREEEREEADEYAAVRINERRDTDAGGGGCTQGDETIEETEDHSGRNGAETTLVEGEVELVDEDAEEGEVEEDVDEEGKDGNDWLLADCDCEAVGEEAMFKDGDKRERGRLDTAREDEDEDMDAAVMGSPANPTAKRIKPESHAKHSKANRREEKATTKAEEEQGELLWQQCLRERVAATQQIA